MGMESATASLARRDEDLAAAAGQDTNGSFVHAAEGQGHDAPREESDPHPDGDIGSDQEAAVAEGAAGDGRGQKNAILQEGDSFRQPTEAGEPIEAGEGGQGE